MSNKLVSFVGYIFGDKTSIAPSNFNELKLQHSRTTIVGVEYEGKLEAMELEGFIAGLSKYISLNKVL